ncbi:SsgA family sporulation/cell division regulator [Streptomyces sp. NBC_01387]|uniref:SsgA family sporulation/cell division regulator n=1 Tax=unclassified Streptomyces TaxID=2593676 RepID=UPI0020254F15|nr:MULTISPECIES: SsgA family sporulation/cell division regulator [unclassified Streptomyces]MCX4553805.1 SsgA family sporulation/cell division regulator [Streptomyces sp. NBC_01500]WSC18720.1 SsgA family sporulation/cell division regulator [Streptomyces sp. NBC_01766]WSV52754.1 SsgA family sporulation/cell division regulator [Streptomyces sp. NBC_01014]
MPYVVEQAVQARLVTSAPRMETVPTTLRYDREDPFAVSVGFPPQATLAGIEVCWAFARELLAAGVSGPAGLGDVRIRPYGYDRTVLEFHAREGIAMVHVHTAELRRFLEKTEALVPAGREHSYLDVDQDVAELLRDAC